MASNNSRYIQIGILVLFAVAILIWGINFLKGKNFFQKENNYFVIYDRIDGLVESSAVVLNGYKIGQVRHIGFMKDNSGRLVVEFAVNKNIMMPDSTVAKISSTDIMGTKSIEIILGNSKNNHIAGDTLFSDVEQSLKDQVSIQMLPLKIKAEELMSSIDSVLAVVQYIFNDDTKDNITKTFASIKMTILNLEYASGALDTLLRNEKGKLGRIFSNVEYITSNLKNNNEQISNIIANLNNLSDSLAKSNISNTMMQVNKAMTDFNTILSKVKNGEGTIGMLANNDTLYNNMENATFHLNRLLEDIQKNPKKYLHFSLFDFGRTINIKDDKELPKKVK